MSDFKAEKSEVPELSWASDRLRKDIAPHGGVKERIRDAAVALGWKYSRARTIWYADERASVKPKELRRITAAFRTFAGALDRSRTGRTD